YRPPVPFSYSQSMNWMLSDANNKHASVIIHFHSDAFSTNPDAVSELLAYVYRDKQAGLRRGLWWTYYDILFALNVEALNEIGGWDTLFNSYFVDQDLKRRLRLAGWECHDTHIQGISHEGSATINSDPKLQLIHSISFPLTRMLYLAKWGGEPEKEQFRFPFNNPQFDLKP
ncbi:MAG: glycosyltransferase family 2 protein, partial [Patescibacteria group bacterium]|nr:glycosyltransferase family 2 protein [Patescibacteria group bacterium]